jgi:hypothetical protein
MNEYVKKSISKEALTESRTDDVLKLRAASGGEELRHGEWIVKARARVKARMFANPRFALVIVFILLFAGSVFLFENMEVLTHTLYATKIIMSSLFAVSLGFILSVWWSGGARFEERIKEAERIDVEYRELLMSFSDSLFDIINALNTLAAKPPRPFVIATEFLLGEYVHLLQSRLQRYGDYIAGLGFDATAFLDEKIRIFEGIRERASLSIQDMPKELETVFIDSLKLDISKLVDSKAQRQHRLRAKLQELAPAHEGEKKHEHKRLSA